MTANVFGESYAEAYDALYTEKDYAAECDLIECVLADHDPAPVEGILDLGCGTGSHALILGERGCTVVGVDRSEPMLRRARERALRQAVAERVTFELGDIRTVQLGTTFDAAVMLFAVLGYQTENVDAVAALRTARRHLSAGRLLLFDVWYGPAVLHERPSDRVRVIETERGAIVRTAASTVDDSTQICRVTFRVFRVEEGGGLEETRETHAMRYFFPRELELLLEAAGFELVRIGSFPAFDREPHVRSWSVLVAARAV